MAVEMNPSSTPEARPIARDETEVSIFVRKDLDAGFRLDVKFSIQAGITIVFGASGSGKTTLLNCIAGVATPDFGKIEFLRDTLFDSEKNVNVRISRRRVAYVFQSLALFPHLTAAENVAYGLAALPARQRKNQVQEILESFHIAHLARRKPSEISGGERQRVALARSLVICPRILLLDEPLAALDAGIKNKIVEDLRAWNARHRIPILYVTHSREEVFALGERVIVLDRGKVIADGRPHQIIRAPRQETLAQLAGFENIFDARVTAVHEDRGTLTCRLDNSSVELETPLVSAAMGMLLRVAISAGDILLSAVCPKGLSARNVIPGRIVSLEQRDVIVIATVNCGVEMHVQLTLAARDSLYLRPGTEVWLIIKTHSCHLLAG